MLDIIFRLQKLLSFTPAVRFSGATSRINKQINPINMSLFKNSKQMTADSLTGRINQCFFLHSILFAKYVPLCKTNFSSTSQKYKLLKIKHNVPASHKCLYNIRIFSFLFLRESPTLYYLKVLNMNDESLDCCKQPQYICVVQSCDIKSSPIVAVIQASIQRSNKIISAYTSETHTLVCVCPC